MEKSLLLSVGSKHVNYGCSFYENALQEKHPSKRERKWRPLRGVIALCLIATAVCLAWVPHAVAAEGKYPIGALEFDFLTSHSPPLSWTKTLRGNIPLYAINPTLGTLWCKGEFQDVAIYDVVGEGTLDGTRHERHSVGPCEFRMDGGTRTVNVKIKGKLWWKPNELQCSDETLSISFIYTRLAEEGIGRTYCQGRLVGTQPVKKVREGEEVGGVAWYTGFSPISETVEFQRFDGMTFERSYSSGDTQYKERLILHVPDRGYPDLTKPSLRYESPPPDPTRAGRARIGPPLNQVPYGMPPKK